MWTHSVNLYHVGRSSSISKCTAPDASVVTDVFLLGTKVDSCINSKDSRLKTRQDKTQKTYKMVGDILDIHISWPRWHAQSMQNRLLNGWKVHYFFRIPYLCNDRYRVTARYCWFDHNGLNMRRVWDVWDVWSWSHMCEQIMEIYSLISIMCEHVSWS